NFPLILHDSSRFAFDSPQRLIPRFDLAADPRLAPVQSLGRDSRGPILKTISAGGLQDHLRAWFPEREFFMRSHGQVRFITITSRMQIAAAALAVALIGGWGLSMGAMAISQYRAESERLSLLEREAEVASSESRLAIYRDDLDAVVGDLERRQVFLEEMTEMLPADAVDGETVTDSSDEAARMVEKVSAAIPEAAGLARLE